LEIEAIIDTVSQKWAEDCIEIVRVGILSLVVVMKACFACYLNICPEGDGLV
jgi:hypothetical protein